MTDTDKCIHRDLDTMASMLSSLTNHGYNPLSEEASHASLVVRQHMDILVTHQH